MCEEDRVSYTPRLDYTRMDRRPGSLQCKGVTGDVFVAAAYTL
jgi:hypothetical protein